MDHSADQYTKLESLITGYKFRLCRLELKKCDSPLQDNEVWKLWLVLGHTVHTRTEKIHEYDLLVLSKALLDFLGEVAPLQFDKYLRVLFYIGSFFLEKQAIQEFFGLGDLYFPSHISGEMKMKNAPVYTSLSNNLYRCLAKSRSFSIGPKSVHFIFSLMNFVKNPKYLYNLRLLLINTPSYHTNSTENNVSYYTQYLQTVETWENSEVHAVVLQYASFIIHIETTRKNLSVVDEILRAMSKTLQKWFPQAQELIRCLVTFSYLFTASDPSQASDSLRIYIGDNPQITAFLKESCYFICNVSYATYLYCKQADNTYWTNLELRKWTKYYLFLQQIAVVLAHITNKSDGEENHVSMWIKEIIRIYNSIIDIHNLHLIHAKDVPKTLNKFIVGIVKQAVTWIQMIKKKNTSDWVSCWKSTTIGLYNITSTCQKNEDFELGVEIANAMIRSYIELEGLTSMPTSQRCITYAFGMLFSMTLALKQYRQCMEVAVVRMLVEHHFDPTAPNRPLFSWAEITAAVRDDPSALDLQEKSTLDIASSCLKTYFGHYSLTKEHSILLLKRELLSYKAHFKSKGLMMVAFKQLAQLEGVAEMAEFTVELFEDGSSPIHDELPQILYKVLRNYEQLKSQSVTLLRMYFLCHRYKVNNVISKACKEIEDTLMMTHYEDINLEPDTVCDIVSSYESLRLRNYWDMMQYLRKSYTLAKHLMASEQNDENLYKVLKTIALEFNLHRWNKESWKIWTLAMRLAKTKTQKLEVISSICELKHDPKLVKQGDIIADEMNVTGQIVDELIVFHIVKSCNLIYTDPDEAYVSYTTACELLDSCEEPNFLTKMRLACLRYKFMMLSKKFAQDESPLQFGPWEKSHKEMWIHYYNNMSKSSLTVRLFFEVSVCMVEFYRDTLQPAKIRYYCKELLVIAQKMMLPFQSIQLLTYLATADFDTGRFDDLRVKVDGIVDILDLAFINQNTSRENCDHLTDELDRLVETFREVMLVDRQKPSSQSPTVLTQSHDTFNVGDYVHPDTCRFICCSNVEYKKSVLSCVYFNAVLSVHNDTLKNAQRIFREGIAFYRLDPKPDLVYTYCLVLYEYCNMLLRENKLAIAGQINGELLSVVDSNRIEYGRMRNAAWLQSIDIDILVDMATTSKQIVDLNWAFRLDKRRDLSPIASKAKVQEEKTPEDKRNPAVQTYESTKQEPSPKLPKKRLKPLKFDLSDGEDDEKKPEPKETYRTRSRGRPVLENATPAPNQPVGRELRSRSKLLTEKLKKSKQTENLPDIQITDENNVKKRIDFEANNKVNEAKPVRTRSNASKR